MLARNIVPNTVCSEHLFGTDVRNRQCSERGSETVFGTDVRNRCSEQTVFGTMFRANTAYKSLYLETATLYYFIKSLSRRRRRREEGAGGRDGGGGQGQGIWFQ